MRESKGQLLKAILEVVEKHPNTKLSKLIKCVESERTQKNIVLLLIELAEHPEFASNISISLKYYLDLFEELPEEPSFSEAGLLILNSAIIYGKRVDNVHLAIEKLILSLINSENEEEQRPDTNQNAIPKAVGRGRKRPLEELSGPYEADMSIKRFKTISNSKRFDEGASSTLKKNSNSLISNRAIDSVQSLSKEYSHPTIWKYSVIEDYDYDDEVDSKKNYKLFTYHLEHRYNTLIPDINFKMYFKMKDFIDAESQELWPPLSDAYIEHYVNLENQILCKDGHDTRETTNCNVDQIDVRVQDELPNTSNLISDLQMSKDNHLDSINQCEASQQIDNITVDSGIYMESLQSSSLDVSTEVSECQDVPNECQDVPNAESRVVSEVLHNITVNEASISDDAANDETPLLSEQTQNVNVINDSGIECDTHVESGIEENETDVALCPTDNDPTILVPKVENEDLTTIKVILPHLDDEGVFFSDLDERDQQMLSPAVVATDVFRCIKDKSNIVVIVDDEIKRIYNIQEPRQEVLSLPVFTCPDYPSLPLNILKIHHKYFKKRRAFKLGSEFHILKKERHKKYIRDASNPNPNQPRKRVRLCEDVTGVPLSPPSSPNYEPDFYGFPEEVHNDKNRTLSRDSGISLQQIENTSDKEIIDEVHDCKDILESAIQSNIENALQSEHNSDDQQENNDLRVADSNQLPETNEGRDLTTNSEETLCQQIENSDCNQDADLDNHDLDELSENNLGTSINENLPLVMSKVQEWHAHLQPILAQSRDRHHFDVFELGSEIMSQFDRHDINNKIISLNHVMENKDNSLISRYFLSTLLLANQGNVSININNKSSEMPSKLNDVELRLLSRKRNIVSLEDNIGLKTPQISIERPTEEYMPNIRTVKPVPTTTQSEDRDSGISMSDGCSI